MEVKRFEKYTRLLSRPLSWIDNLYDPTVVSAAQFAVAEYNKKTKTPLYFINVIKGKRLVVRGQYKGDLYHLIISAADYTKTHPKRYEIAVMDQRLVKKSPWKLESFKQFPHSIFN
ncbi:hypothetical protein ABFX02_09G008400 [Erythranthe guttata]